MATEGIYIQGNARGCCSPPPTHHEHQYPFTNDLSHMCVHIYISHVDATHAYRHRHRLHMGTEMQTDTATVIGGERIDKRCGLYIYFPDGPRENAASREFWRIRRLADSGVATRNMTTLLYRELWSVLLWCAKKMGGSQMSPPSSKNMSVSTQSPAPGPCAPGQAEIPA